jgi:DNA invertase Pin-like site-specific DNA recombinase
MSRIGYARVSSKDQNLDSQLDLLKAAGCERVFEDKISGVKESRPEWDRLLEFLREGDTVVVAELSRMTRSLMHLLSLVKEFEQRGVQIVSLREHIDTSTATGRAFLSILGAINQMERELKSERAAAGRASAKARGRTGGRPRTDATKLENARVLYQNSDKSVAEVCSTLGIGRRTFFSYLQIIKLIPPTPHAPAAAGSALRDTAAIMADTGPSEI